MPLPKKDLRAKSFWVRCETIRIHQRAPETRLASSLSLIEILTVLFYGDILRFDPQNPAWENRDRLIVSKGHGSIGLYPILADLGFFDPSELERVCQDGSFLGGIPDPIIPGYETVNGSLGHGLGVACGMAMGLQQKANKSRVVVILGDAEIQEGSVWEAIMFAGHHRLSNLFLIIDDNQCGILGATREVMDLGSLADKLSAFGWLAAEVNGHDLQALQKAIHHLYTAAINQPRVLVAHTQKGHGVKLLETDPLCHVRSLTSRQCDQAIEELGHAQ